MKIIKIERCECCDRHYEKGWDGELKKYTNYCWKLHIEVNPDTIDEDCPLEDTGEGKEPDLYTCDRCRKLYNPNEGFIGRLDGSEECSPFMHMDHLCEACYTKHILTER